MIESAFILWRTSPLFRNVVVSVGAALALCLAVFLIWEKGRSYEAERNAVRQRVEIQKREKTRSEIDRKVENSSDADVCRKIGGVWDRASLECR